jgi:polysaccharide pyruvyl transferase CsaB
MSERVDAELPRLPLKIVLSGYYGFDNAGDEAVLTGVIDSLRQHSPEAKIVVLSGNPERTKNAYGVNAVPRMSIAGIYRALNGADLLISGGGSLFQDVTSNRTIPYYASIVKVASYLHTPIFMYAQGVGPINGKLGRIILSNLRNNFSAVTVRDNESARVLGQLGFSDNHIEVTVDPVFGLAPLSKESGRTLLLKEGIPVNPRVAISLRHWHDDERTTESMHVLIQHIRQLGHQIVLLPFQYPDDLRICDKLVEICGTDNLFVLRQAYSPRQLLSITSLFDLVVGMRLHALIFAAKSEVPFIGVSYDPKVSAFCRQMGLQYVDVDGLEGHALISCYDEVWDARSQIKKNLEDIQPILRRRALDTARKAIEVAIEHHRKMEGVR